MTKVRANHPGCCPRRAQAPGFTLIELLLVLVVIGILAALLLPVVSKAKKRGVQTQCLNHLRQVGVAAHAFAHDHAEGFPFQVSTNTGGTLEFVRAANTRGGDVFYAYRHFQALSNELDVTGLLLCPADSRSSAPDFAQLRNENLSYFVVVSAEFSQPDTVLAGDRNISLNNSQGGAVLRPDRNTPVVWTGGGHDLRGNLLFADGRVENTSRAGLQSAIQSSPTAVSAWVPVASTPQSAGGSGSSGGNGPGSGNGGGNAGGGSGGGSSGFAVVQNFFQQTTVNNPPPNNPPPSSPADSRPPSTPPTVPPPGVPPPAMAQNAAKPAPEMAKAAKPGDVALAPAAEKPAGAGTDATGQQPVNIMLFMLKPETCWSCWLAVLLGALLAAVLMAWAVQRQRQQRKPKVLA